MAYIPTTDEDRRIMLETIGARSIDDLFAPIPQAMQVSGALNIPAALDQITLTAHYQALAAKNADADRYPTFLGAGVYDHYVPPTVGAITGRSEFYTSYTSYQPEVSQGTLQSIYEFQTLIAELYGMDIANASMYDAATGLAEAAIMATEIKSRRKIVALATINPTHIKVLQTYLRHLDIELIITPAADGTIDLDRLAALVDSETAGVLVQHPNFFGNLEDVELIREMAHKNGALLIASADPISLGILTPPGEYGADIAVGEGQPLGCTMGYGGPMLGLFACKAEYMRRIPGRIVGQTKDIEGRRAFVMTLRTREQDIRRERATSNICTNVALYALAGTVYLATMGKRGLRQVAELSLQKAHYAANQIAKLPGFELSYSQAKFFKEFAVDCPIGAKDVNSVLWQNGIIGGLPIGPNQLLIAVTEKRTKAEIDKLVSVLGRISSPVRVVSNERNGNEHAADKQITASAAV